MYVNTAVGGVALIGLAVALSTDIRHNKIRNWLTVPLFLLGIAINSALHGWHGLASALLGFGAVAVILTAVLMILGPGIGGGDIKLMMALGALLGWPAAGWLLLYTALSGAVVTVPVMLRHRIFLATWRNLTWYLLRRRMGERGLAVADGSVGPKLPFAVCATLGVLGVVFLGPLM
jgi:prepilin peptidase CpaA